MRTKCLNRPVHHPQAQCLLEECGGILLLGLHIQPDSATIVARSPSSALKPCICGPAGQCFCMACAGSTLLWHSPCPTHPDFMRGLLCLAAGEPASSQMFIVTAVVVVVVVVAVEVLVQ